MINPDNGLRIGIVGYGGHGSMHAEALRNLPEAANFGQLNTLVYDIDAVARQKALEAGFQPVESLRALLELRPCAVITAIPMSENLRIVEEIANFEGVCPAVLIEKPLAPDVSTAEKIMRASQNLPLTMYGLVGRYHPEFAKAYSFIQSGAFGEFRSFQEQIHLGNPELLKKYLQTGVLLENGTHSIDHLLFLSGISEWKVLSAVVSHHEWHEAGPDTVTAFLINPETHATALISLLWPSEHTVLEEGYRTTIEGKTAHIGIHGFDRTEIRRENGQLEITNFHPPDADLTAKHLPGLIAEQTAFFAAVLNNQNSPIPLGVGIQITALIESIENHAKEHKTYFT